MKFDHITIVYIDGRERDYENGQRVVLKSMHELPGSKGLLLTPSSPIDLHSDIEHKEIPKLGYQEYSLFVIYALHQFIDTEFVIIVQEDGWVLNGEAWSDEFINYDFIGAPIHLARVTDESGESRVYQGFGWTQFSNNEKFKIENVFNGGFSLRSKRFLEAPARFKIPYLIPAPIGLGKFPKVLKWEDEGNQEDAQIFLYMRDSLEKVGIKFPTIDIAKYFSFEHLTPIIHEDIDLNRVLGHHAYLRSLHKENTICYPVSFREVCNIYGENRVIDLFSGKGYSFSFAS
jgi:hypothetical protein